MNEPNSDKPKRRARYAGANPRTFAQKYKEHNADRYPSEQAKVIARGDTPAGTHRPIMVDEIMRALSPNPGDVIVDCTLGFGGHAMALLAAVQPHGKLIGFDADPIELPKTEARLRSMGYPSESLSFHRTNFASLCNTLAMDAPAGVQIVLADLGISSMQIDDPTRGFSFKTDGPLDMRMNPMRGQSASQLLSNLDSIELSTILSTNSDEPNALALACRILEAHSQTPIRSTFQLAAIVRQSLSKARNNHTDEVADSVRRVFQALRIEVNDEFSVLDSLLRQLPSCLAPGGRVAILSFHSGEDRRVKHAFQSGLENGLYSNISSQFVRPSLQEQHSNPRSKSAKLRFATRAS